METCSKTLGYHLIQVERINLIPGLGNMMMMMNNEPFGLAHGDKSQKSWVLVTVRILNLHGTLQKTQTLLLSVTQCPSLK